MPSAVAMFYPVFMPLNKKTANVLCPIRAVKQWKVDLWETSYSQSTFCLLTPEIRGEKPRQLHSTTLNITRVLFLFFFSTLLFSITYTESIYGCIYIHWLYHLTWYSDSGHISMTSGKADSKLTNTNIQGLNSKSTDKADFKSFFILAISGIFG